MATILRVKNLTKTFELSHNLFRKEEIVAVKPMTFSLSEGKTLAIIGKNGSGKSTLAKMLAGMIEPTDGEIWVEDNKLQFGDYHYRSKLIRMIFQNSASSFDPQLRIGQLLELPLKLNTELNANERENLIYAVLKQVGLRPEHASYYPSVMAVGQKQRVALARALILNPKVIIADEAIRSLDSSAYSQIINLMLSLQEEKKISYICVTQDIGMMKHISDDILVMHNGEAVEYGKTSEVIASPLSDITKKLIYGYFDET